VSAVLAALFVLGLVLGSFANVLIHRLPRRESIVFPGSRCPRCGHPIPWYQNVPVLSWLGLRGRCAFCAGRISIRYPLVELAMGVLFLLCGLRWRTPADTAAACLFVFLCLPLGVIDLEHQILPDRLTFPGIVAGLACSPFVGWTTPLQSLEGALAGAAIPSALIGVYALFGVDAMGWGDVKLLAMTGAFLGWKGLLLTLLWGAVLGTVLGGSYLLLTRRSRRTPLPFGTFLAAAAAAALFVQGPVWTWYLGLMTASGP